MGRITRRIHSKHIGITLRVVLRVGPRLQMSLAGEGLKAGCDTLSADKRCPVHLTVALGPGGDKVAVGNVDDGHGNVVVVSKVADVLAVCETTIDREATGSIEFVLRDALRVADQRGRVVLVADQLQEVLGADARLVRQREALREQLDEAKLEGVPGKPGVSGLTA